MALKANFGSFTELPVPEPVIGTVIYLYRRSRKYKEVGHSTDDGRTTKEAKNHDASNQRKF